MRGGFVVAQLSSPFISCHFPRLNVHFLPSGQSLDFETKTQKFRGKLEGDFAKWITLSLTPVKIPYIYRDLTEEKARVFPRRKTVAQNMMTPISRYISRS